VLAALADGEPMTAGEVAEKSGLARAPVSSTLSRLARSGEVQKAARGYRLAIAGSPIEPATSTVTDTLAGKSSDTAASETAETAGASDSEAAAAAGASSEESSLATDPDAQ
jgi:hypothetical protein